MEEFYSEMSKYSTAKVCTISDINTLNHSVDHTKTDFKEIVTHYCRIQCIIFSHDVSKFIHRPELDDWSCLGFLAGVSSECYYVGCLDENSHTFHKVSLHNCRPFIVQ